MNRGLKSFLRRDFSAVKISVACAAVTVLCCSPVSAWAQASPKEAAHPSAQSAHSLLGKSFASPEEAAEALDAAATKNNENALVVIFGPDARDVVDWSQNPEDRQSDSQLFAQKYAQMHRLVKEPDGTYTLYVGAENWPLPVPLLEKNGAWYFDIGAGKREILYRRIGKNEMIAMDVCHSLQSAEQDYYGVAHRYAPKFMSSEKAHDGLFWPVSTSTEKSPIGPFLAHAGYSNSAGAGLAPFHGYYYRILLEQGPDAPGGARNYIVDGQMTGGFAILAFPVEYRSSGVMTFLMGQDGVIYQKDLGPMTEKLAEQIDRYNPDKTWKKAE